MFGEIYTVQVPRVVTFAGCRANLLRSDELHVLIVESVARLDLICNHNQSIKVLIWLVSPHLQHLATFIFWSFLFAYYSSLIIRENECTKLENKCTCIYLCLTSL